jgi:hypothetical protein
VGWTVPFVLIELCLVLGLSLESAGFGYPEPVSPIRAVSALFRPSGLAALRRPETLFLPITVVAVLAGALVLRRRLPGWAVLATASFRFVVVVVAALLLFARDALVSPLMAPIGTVLFPGADGEFYSEGWPVIVAIGWWFWFALALGVRDVLNRRVPPGECPRCGYPITAASGRSPRCSKCGYAL